MTRAAETTSIRRVRWAPPDLRATPPLGVPSGAIVGAPAVCLLALTAALAAGARNPRTSTEVLDSSQIKEDPVAAKKSEAAYLKHLAREDRHLRLRFDRDHLAQHKAALGEIMRNTLLHQMQGNSFGALGKYV